MHPLDRKRAFALLVSIALHVVALTVLFSLDSLWVSKRRSEPAQVRLVAGEALPPVPERIRERPESGPREIAKAVPALREERRREEKKSVSPQRPVTLSPPAFPPPVDFSPWDPHESVVALIERYRRGDLAADSTGVWFYGPEERARDLAFEMLNASFRELRPEIEAERFLEAFRCNFPYMR
jgi:hypothetical protein